MEPNVSPPLLRLPLELLHSVISLLPLDSIHHLGATCRHLHRLIHQDDLLWRFKVKKRLRLKLLAGDATNQIDIENDDHDEDEVIDGLVRDSTLQGHKELFLLYSDEFKHSLRQCRSQVVIYKYFIFS